MAVLAAMCDAYLSQIYCTLGETLPDRRRLARATPPERAITCMIGMLETCALLPQLRLLVVLGARFVRPLAQRATRDPEVVRVEDEEQADALDDLKLVALADRSGWHRPGRRTSAASRVRRAHADQVAPCTVP